ncbi:MAG: class I SAM-dependent methyltransferase [Flavobacteriaceae bacterium]|nr:class I SAM-dependent methyltransferase [Flavobacteriaceae bacterium]
MVNQVLEKENLREIAHQLRCPKGEEGIKMGDLLSESNKGMIYESIQNIPIKSKNRILELGHGNGAHVGYILKRASQLGFFGLEISDTMIKEAKRINFHHIKNRKAVFLPYNGIDIPYAQGFFHQLLCVNTIYFWDKPLRNLHEIYRVLKPEGHCILCFAKEGFMKELPFVHSTNTFELYSNDKLIALLKQTDFTVVRMIDKSESIKSKTGIWVERDYTIAILRK